MTQLNYRFLQLILGFLFLTTNLTAQSVNFEETWKEFLDNNKIVNMSALNKPNKEYDPLNYIKYLLMNTNSSFCQSDVERAEKLLAGINDIEVRAHQAIPGFVKKLEDLETKVKAYHSIDAIWMDFLNTRVVDFKKLRAVKAAKTLCEKATLAKYSYMTAYHHYCKGEVAKAKNIIENRTLKLTEKTSLRVEDVEGLSEEVASMKTLFQNMSKLDSRWKDYMETGISPGFNVELPYFPCYPIPNIKEWVLKGAVDVCKTGPKMLEKIQKVQDETGVSLDGALADKVKELKGAITENKAKDEVVNKAWKSFIPNNEVTDKSYRKFDYEFCSKETLIRTYIMDGFANVCGLTDERLQEIDKLQDAAKPTITKETVGKIYEMQEMYIQYQADETDINTIWNTFVAQGDKLDEGSYRLADYYCDHVYDVKAWIIRALSTDCKEALQYLEQIDEVKENLEFEFAHDIKCRVEKIRANIWDCKYEALKKIAEVQTSPDSMEEKMAALIEEYGIGERPEVCVE